MQDVTDGVVSYTTHYRFVRSDTELVSQIRLRFRTEDELRRSLGTAGFRIHQIYGDWDRDPATDSAPELIVVAQLQL